MNQINFGARTGGANDNHWIDDLNAVGYPPDDSGLEASQQVHFEVSNNNPSLFSSQPAIGPNGTLTYTPAPNACGSAQVTAVLVDDGGTACSGADRSAPCVFNIAVGCVNDAPSFTKGNLIFLTEDFGPVTVPAWAKNISAGPPDESGQLLNFLVSNNNPGLFSTQPAIDPSGTVTFQTAPNACGSATVTVALMDNGGTANGGDDTSDSCTFDIIVQCVNDCPTAQPLAVVTDEDMALPITLVGTDPDMDPLTYKVVSGPAHGTLTGTGAARTYTPTNNYSGPDSFTYWVADGSCTSAVATVSITVRPVNDAPTAVIKVRNLCNPTPLTTNLVIIAANSSNGCVVLDASMSTDPDGNTLTYSWLLDASVVPFSSAVRTTNCTLSVGTHTIRLIVDDGQSTATATVVVEVISGCDAVEDLIVKVNTSSIDRKTKRPLIAKLKEACSEFEKAANKKNSKHIEHAVKKLEDFQKKVLAKRTTSVPPRKGDIPAAQADEWIADAQKIIDASNCCISNSGSGNGHHDDDDDDSCHSNRSY